MRLVNNHQPYVLECNHAILQAVVQGFYHGHKAHMVVLVLQFLYIAVDDHVLYRKTAKHTGCLAAQLNPVGKDHHFLFGRLNIPARYFRKNHRFSTTCRKLIKEVHVVGSLLEVAENGIQVFNLVIIKRFLYVFGTQFQ